jgi:hypothetical protein
MLALVVTSVILQCVYYPGYVLNKINIKLCMKNEKKYSAKMFAKMFAKVFAKTW